MRETDTRGIRGNTSRDRVRKMAEEKQRRGGGSTLLLPDERPFWKPRESSSSTPTLIDIIPYVVSVDGHKWGVVKGDLWFERTYLVHHGIGVDQKSYVCPRTVGKRCPICEHQAQMRKEGADKDLIKAIRTQEKQLFNVVDKNDEAKGVQIWDYAYNNFGRLLEEEIRNQDPEFADFFQPDRGYTLRVRFVRDTFAGNTFFPATRIDFMTREPYGRDVTKKALDLDTILNVLPYEDLKKIFLEMGEEPVVVPTERPVQRRTEPEPEPEVGFPEQDDQPVARRQPPAQEAVAEDQLPARRRVGSPQPDEDQGTAANPCPQGFRYGVDTDAKDACRNCGDEWQGCYDEKERLAKAQQTQRRGRVYR